MNIAYSLFLGLMVTALFGCTNEENEETTNNRLEMIPNYLAINAPPDNSELPWYVSDFFKRVPQWDRETTDYDSLKMGMYELTQYPNRQPTPAQTYAANKLVSDSFDAVLRNGWLSKEKGLRDGFEKMFGDPVHFVNVEYVFDGETLNPEKPEVLMYYKTKEGDFLMGVMFLAIGERGPQVGGPLSKWHYHIDRRMCYDRGVLPIGRVGEEGACETGIQNIRSPEMLHVWFFDHPAGKFATSMGLPEHLLESGIKQIIELQETRM